MRFNSFIGITTCVTLLGAGFSLGCGYHGTSSEPGSPTEYGQSTGSLVIHTAPAHSRLYAEVNVNVKAIAVLDVDGVWHEIGRPGRMINLLSLDLEARALLDVNVDAKLKVGRYTKLRLTLGDGCNVKLLDGTIRELRLAAELSAGLHIDIDLNIRAKVRADLFIGLDLDACLQLVVNAGSPCYYLRPIFTAVDRVLTGTISGVVRAKVTGEVIAKARVFAEYFDADGRAHIAASVVADINGRYKFEGLPLGRVYHIVCNPPGFGRAFKLFASLGLDLDVDVSARVLDIDLDVDLDLNLNAMGSVRGAITPGISLDGCDYVSLVTELACGIGCSKWFIIDHLTAKVDANVEAYLFGSLGNGRYMVHSKRQRCNSGGLCSWDPLWLSAAVDVDLNVNLDVILGIRL